MKATLVEWMGPEDANGGGFVHGGTIMRLCDEAAGLAAVRHCRVRCVTAGMDRMTFESRVDVGSLVEQPIFLRHGARRTGPPGEDRDSG